MIDLTEPFTQADSLRLQKLQQGLSGLQTQLDEGSLDADTGANLKQQVLSTMGPLKARQQQAREQARQEQMMELHHQAAAQESIELQNTNMRAQSLPQQVVAYTDPMSGRTAHLLPDRKGGWQEIAFNGTKNDPDFSSSGADFNSDSTPQDNSIDAFPLGGGAAVAQAPERDQTSAPAGETGDAPPYGDAGAAEPAPVAGTPGEQEWEPAKGFHPTLAQRQVMAIAKTGGSILTSTHEQALRDRQAQMEGLSRDPNPSPAEVDELWRRANQMVKGNGPNATAMVMNLFDHLLAGHQRTLTNRATREAIAHEHRTQEQAKAALQASRPQKLAGVSDQALMSAARHHYDRLTKELDALNKDVPPEIDKVPEHLKTDETTPIEGGTKTVTRQKTREELMKDAQEAAVKELTWVQGLRGQPTAPVKKPITPSLPKESQAVTDATARALSAAQARAKGKVIKPPERQGSLNDVGTMGLY